MNCPNCGERLRVMCSKPTEETVERYRKCLACNYRCYTTEAKSNGDSYRKLLREQYRKGVTK